MYINTYKSLWTYIDNQGEAHSHNQCRERGNTVAILYQPNKIREGEIHVKHVNVCVYIYKHIKAYRHTY